MKNPKLYLPLSLLACLILTGMLLMPSTPIRGVQAQDMTLSWLNAQATVRQGEIIATAQENRRQAIAATAARQAEINQLNDAATRTALEITKSAAIAQYQAGQTATPRAQMTLEAQASATRQLEAMATAAALATGTAHATQTQIAATRTATAEIAHAVETATMAEIIQEGERKRIEAEQRQRLINQVRQSVYVLGGLVLTVLAGGLTYFSLRWIWAWVKAHLPQARPVQIVEVVKEPEERRYTPEEVRQEVAEMPLGDIRVTTDPRFAEIMYEHIRREGVGPAETAA
jgi:hypothetical protein